MSGKRYLVILALVAIALVSIPYIAGFQSSDLQNQFGGFLINPIDGHSYLAKMQQGLRGEWKFKLPFTAEPGDGAYLYLFYLGLGHLSRILNLPVIVVFHVVRLISAMWLILVISKMIHVLFKDQQTIKAGLLLALFGSGLGWLTVLGGGFTSDFWVAEAYPFLSMYTNPHFCLGLGLMIYTLLPERRDKLPSNLISGLLLGILQPFAVVIVALVKIIDGGRKIYQEKIRLKIAIRSRWFWSRIGFCLAGGVVVLYQYWAILTDPVLSQWHHQNITPGPGMLDLVISLSPSLILGIIGIRKAWKNETGKVLIIWVGISLLLVFIPWNLQRRFLTGIFFPLAALTVFGIQDLAKRYSIRFSYLIATVILLSIPTNLIIISSGLQGIAEKNTQIYLDKDLVAGLKWLKANAKQDDLILADQRNGLYVPSYTGRRVIYGHPFETINAESEKEFLENLFGEKNEDDYYCNALDARSVDYVLINSGEAQSFNNWLDQNWELRFQADEIMVYARYLE